MSRQAFFRPSSAFCIMKKMVGTQCKWFLEQRSGMNWKPQNWCKLLLLSLHTKQINLLPPWVSFFLCLDMFRFLFFLNYIFGHFSFFFLFPWFNDGFDIDISFGSRAILKLLCVEKWIKITVQFTCILWDDASVFLKK